MLKACSTLVGILVHGALPAARLGQAINVGPSFGYYRPVVGFRPADVYASDLPMQPSELAGLAWGAQVGVTLWTSRGYPT